MKGQFIRSCSGRQNILPQCFTDCLDEEWEHISGSAGPGPGTGWGRGWSSNNLAQPHHRLLQTPLGVVDQGHTGVEGGGVCSDGGDGGNVGKLIQIYAQNQDLFRSLTIFLP